MSRLARMRSGSVQWLLFGRGRMHVGIEPHLAQNQVPALHARLARAMCAGVEECAAGSGGGLAGVVPRLAGTSLVSGEGGAYR